MRYITKSKRLTPFVSLDFVIKKFFNDYKLKYNDEPSIFSANSYDAVYIIKDAVIFCNSQENTICIKNYLQSLNYDGVEGNIKFDENGDVIKQVVIKKLDSGKFVNLPN